MSLSRPWCGRRYLDEHQINKLKPATVVRYQQVALRFTTWALEHHVLPSSVDEWDDALVEYKNLYRDGLGRRVSHSDFASLLAAVEFFFPRYKHKLGWAHAVMSAWDVTHETKHTVPMCRGPANLWAVHLCSAGHARLGFGLLLQQRCGLRPSEMLQLTPDAVILPEEQGLSAHTGYAEICLGLRAGTKAKRPQTVVVRAEQEPQLLSLLRIVKQTTPAGKRLVPYSIDNMRKWLKLVDGILLNAPSGYTPHSPRSGFASEGRARGIPFQELKEQGRWLSDSSLRVYIDIQQAAAIAAGLRAAGLAPAQAWAGDNLGAFFTVQALAAAYL